MMNTLKKTISQIWSINLVRDCDNDNDNNRLVLCDCQLVVVVDT